MEWLWGLVWEGCGGGIVFIFEWGLGSVSLDFLRGFEVDLDRLKIKRLIKREKSR